MIVVDSSVWVAAFRGDGPIGAELARLLDDDFAALTSPVRLELLGGSKPSDFLRLRRVLGAVPSFVPSTDGWKRVETWVDKAARPGQRFGIVDLLIGATAAEHRASVWSLDADFERMAKLRFVKLHRPRRGRGRRS